MRRNLRIAYDLAARDLAARFAQSAIGPIWLVLTPLSFVLIYWLVFSYFLKLEWTDPVTGVKVGYVAPFFAGLTVYLFFTEIILSSLTIFSRKRDYVRKSPFPLWVLWASNVLRAGAIGAVNLIILFIVVITSGAFHFVALLWLPLAVGIVLFSALGLSLILSLLGPFFGDLEEASRVILRILFYAAPVTYPLSLVPDRLQPFLWLNPMTTPIEVLRRAAIFGLAPEPLPLALFLAVVMGLAALGLWLYTRVRGAVVDVV